MKHGSCGNRLARQAATAAVAHIPQASKRVKLSRWVSLELSCCGATVACVEDFTKSTVRVVAPLQNDSGRLDDRKLEVRASRAVAAPHVGLSFIMPRAVDVL